MPLTPDHRERLADCAAAGDRETEPVFVGRDDLFEVLAQNAQSAVRGACRGRTLCFSGPPGIGKTAWITELRKRPPEDTGAHAVLVRNDVLWNPRLVLAAMVEQLPPWVQAADPAALMRKWGGTVAKRLSKAGIPGIFTVELNAAPPPSDSPGFPWADARRLLKNRPSKSAVVLLIDEAHNRENTDGKDKNVLLADLHEGDPEVPVFAALLGHVQTPDVLDRSILAGRWSDDNQRPMKPLTGEQSRDYAVRMLHWFDTGETELAGPAGAEQRRLAGWVDRECAGWPHHLRNAMASVAEEQLRADSMRLADLDGRRIEENLTLRRLRYYSGRLRSPAFDGMERVIGKVLADLRAKPMNRAGMVASAARHIRDAGEDAWWKYDRPRAAAEALALGAGGMIEKGLVGRTWPGDDERYVCPIASMRKYVETGKHEVEKRFPDLAR